MIVDGAFALAMNVGTETSFRHYRAAASTFLPVIRKMTCSAVRLSSFHFTMFTRVRFSAGPHVAAARARS